MDNAEKFRKIVDSNRIQTILTMKKITDYEDLNVYSMDVLFDYNLDHITPVGVYDTQKLMELLFNEVAPGIKIDYTAPNYGCSAFAYQKDDGGYLFGRNYDFKFDSSAMLVHCHPKDGYASVAHAALDNVNANDPFSSKESLVGSLTAPFICLDGINEKGLGIAVLTLDSEPTLQNTGKPVLCTTMLIRMVLDKCATTKEAIELIKKYDIFAISGRDYHFFITDMSGDSCVVEFDCEKENRELVATKSPIVTNFYVKYIDQVLPNQKNGNYGHGKERYLAIEDVLTNKKGQDAKEIAWNALKAAAQEPNPESVTSNTQWSIVYDLDSLEYELALHRRFDDIYKFKLTK